MQNDDNEKVRSLYLTEKMKNFAYNVKYKAVGLVEEYSHEIISSPYQKVYILGKLFQSNPSNVHKINQ